MKYVKSFKIYENENLDNEEALYEFDLPGFWEIFGAGAAWEAGKAIGALALALLAIGGVAVSVGFLQIKDKIVDLVRERKRVKGAAEGQDFLLKNPKIQELAKISKELWKAQAGKVDKRRKDWEEKLANLKSIAKDLTQKRQEIAKEIAADIKDAGLSKEAIEYLGTQVSYLGTSYFTKTLMKESVNEGRKQVTMKHLHTFENFLNEGHNYEVKHEVGDEITLPVLGPCKVVEVDFKPTKMYSNPWTSISKDFYTFEPNKLFAPKTHSPQSIGNKAIKLETMDSYKDPVMLYQYESGGKVYSQYAYMN